MKHIGLVLGGLFCLLCGFSEELAGFLVEMEKDTYCKSCSQKDNCIALKKVYSVSGESNFLNEWMLVTFFLVRKRCEFIHYKKNYRCYVWMLIGFIAFIIPFWSKEFTLIGFLYGITGIILLFLTVVDWNSQYIPFECNVLIFLCGLIHLYTNFSNWLDYIIGLFAVSGFLLLLDRISTPVLKKQYGEDVDQVIGDGDIKLMAATGLLLGWKLNFIALGIGCVMGSVIHLILMKIKGSGHRLAFGPYLSLGVYITMICGEQLVSWYLNFLGVKPL